MPKSWNELLRHWRPAGYTITVTAKHVAKFGDDRPRDLPDLGGR